MPQPTDSTYIMPDSLRDFHLAEQAVLQPLHPTDGMLLQESAWYVAGPCTLTADGIEAQPALTHAIDSDALAAALMLAVMCIGLTVGRSVKYLRNAAIEFFYPSDHPNMYEEHSSDAFMHGRILTTILAALTEGIAFHLLMPTQISLTLALGVAAAAWSLRAGLYYYINSVFFTYQQRALWHDGYSLLMLLQGSILALSCGMVASGYSLPLLWIMVLALGLIKILLLVKTQRTFFPLPGQVLHLFSYFCTLELAPLLILISILL